MKNKQIKKLKMYLAVSGVVEKNINKINEVAALKNTYEEFITNNDEIIKLKAENEKSTTAVVDKKSKKREYLVNQTVPICNILQVYAMDANDAKLGKKINYSRNKLTKSTDSELINKSNKVWKTAKQIYGNSLEGVDNLTSKSKKVQPSANINSYGLTGELIDKLENANKEFVESVLTLKDAIAYKNKCAKKITEFVKANDKLLRNKMDRLMTLFELSDKSFYQEYKNARILPQDAEPIKKETKPATAEKRTVQKKTTTRKPSAKKGTTTKSGSTRTRAASKPKTNPSAGE